MSKNFYGFRGRKLRSQRGWLASDQCLPDTARLAHIWTHRDCTGWSQMGSQHETGKWTRSPTHTKTPSPTAHTGKINFSPRVALGMQITLKAPWSAVTTTKRAQRCFCGLLFFFGLMSLCLCNFFTLQSFAYLYGSKFCVYYAFLFPVFFLKILKFSYLFSKDRKKESIELDEWGGGEDL